MELWDEFVQFLDTLKFTKVEFDHLWRLTLNFKASQLHNVQISFQFPMTRLSFSRGRSPFARNVTPSVPLDSSPDTVSRMSSHTSSHMSSHISPWLVPLVYRFGRHLVLPLYFGRIEVHGRENLPRSGPVILAPTHRSRWDALMLPFAAGKMVTGRNLRFMVTTDEVKGLQGWFIRRLGGFAVDTRRPGVASLRHGIDLMEKGEMMVIFPEGNIFRDRTVQPLKAGFARLAIQAEEARTDLGVQVVPLAIAYGGAMVPWRSTVKIYIGKPILVRSFMHGHGKQDAKALTQAVGDSLQELMDSGFA